MNIEKKELSTIQKDSLFLLSEPSEFARRFLYYMIGLGHFYATERYTEARPSNAYDSFLLLYVLRGRLYAEEEGAGSEAPAGSIVLLDCYGRHRYRALMPTEFVYMHFDGNNARAFYEEISHSRGRVFSDAGFGEQSTALLQLCDSIGNGKMPSEGDVSVLIHRILCGLCSGSAAEYAFRYSPAVRRALRFIEGNFTAGIGVREIARECGLSPQHLSRLFRRETGTSPYACILEKRMRAACELLSFSECTVEEAAERVGYSSPANFMNAFRRHFGMTPGQYRHARP